MLNFNTPDNSQRGGFSDPDDVRPDPASNTPSRILLVDDDVAGKGDVGGKWRREQVPVDLIDEESMESFPCSDPPSYSTCHS